MAKSLLFRRPTVVVILVMIILTYSYSSSSSTLTSSSPSLSDLHSHHHSSHHQHHHTHHKPHHTNHHHHHNHHNHSSVSRPVSPEVSMTTSMPATTVIKDTRILGTNSSSTSSTLSSGKSSEVSSIVPTRSSVLLSPSSPISLSSSSLSSSSSSTSSSSMSSSVSLSSSSHLELTKISLESSLPTSAPLSSSSLLTTSTLPKVTLFSTSSTSSLPEVKISSSSSSLSSSSSSPSSSPEVKTFSSSSSLSSSTSLFSSPSEVKTSSPSSSSISPSSSSSKPLLSTISIFDDDDLDEEDDVENLIDDEILLPVDPHSHHSRSKTTSGSSPPSQPSLPNRKSSNTTFQRNLAFTQVQFATQHMFYIRNEWSCGSPKPKLVKVLDFHASPSKAYVPRCTVLHRCGDESGCCEDVTHRCEPAKSELIELYFHVIRSDIKNNITGGNAVGIEKLTFLNHTKCECRPINYQPRTLLRRPMKLFVKNATSGIPEVKPSRYEKEYQQHHKCRHVIKCPSPFLHRFREVAQRCICDCISASSAAGISGDDHRKCVDVQLGTGKLDGMGQRCVRLGECSEPICGFGLSFSVDDGKCVKASTSGSRFGLQNRLGKGMPFHYHGSNVTHGQSGRHHQHRHHRHHHQGYQRSSLPHHYHSKTKTDKTDKSSGT